MKVKTKVIALLLAVLMVSSMFPVAAADGFVKTKEWNNGLFTDVSAGDWFYENVKSAYELGLMVGHEDGRFEPAGRITIAQTIAVAARVHAIAAGSGETFAQGSPWYQVYVDYAKANGIVTGEAADYNKAATRLEFARILAKAMSDEDLQPINDVEYGDIPDVAEDEAVYQLYRAGVLMGNDAVGTFAPDSTIQRSEMAAIVTRMALPELRIKKEAETAPAHPGNLVVKPDGGSGEEPEQPAPEEDVKVTVEVENVDGKVNAEVSLEGETVKATVPAGVALEEGAKELTLTIDALDQTGSDVTAGEDEALTSYDVHIAGVSADNTVVITVAMGAILDKGLNMGNVALYHVEDGVTNTMTQVATLDELDAHNEFYYDPATGEVTVAMASFSEITIVSEQPKWEGKRDYTWYDASKTELTIANADQLAGFGTIVGGMEGKTADSFAGKTVKLICDINIGDLSDENEGSAFMFYPIGYYNNTGSYEKKPGNAGPDGAAVSSGFMNFEGTFDGSGHTIGNFYQNTWEAFGDYNDGYSGTPNHYRDGFGLFGRVYGGTVKNLTVENFSSDGEFTTTGTIAAYADCGATFENIAIFNCNPRVYNIGNGGIVGCVGWYANEEHTTPVTFKNITVDNTNKISALWGSWDVACGGIVGQYYPTSGQSNAIDNAGIRMENCHVAAQIDVYNDVCANYQYYAYRYAGILIGSVRENVEEDGHVYPNMDGITASECTVHFGDWNDYYYCELVANSLASYTHDHQMSRLTQVTSVDAANKKVVTLKGETVDIPTSGAANYVVVKSKDANGMWIHGDGADYATCYHFVNGEVWNHADAGTETVDGVEVLKEDKQCIYREFNNLVTGYGWGVTSKGVDDMDGVTILDREQGDSKTKFVGKGLAEIESETAIKIGDLFTFVNNGVELKTEGLNVTITDLDDTDGIADATFTPDNQNWENGTLTVHGKGEIAITIQDYYFCAPTTIKVTCIDPFASLDVEATELYVIGQPLDIKSVTVKYAHGESKVLAADKYTVSYVDMSFSGKKFVTVSYTEFGKTVTAELEIKVTDGFNALIASPKKQTYNIGDTVSAADFNVSAVAEDGSKGNVSGYTISNVDTGTKGTKSVTISFTNPNTGKTVSTTCNIRVLNLTKVTGDDVPTIKYWHAGNFAASNNWNHVEQPGTGYETFVGKTYTGANGEISSGFNLTGHTAAQPMSGYNNLAVTNAKPYTLLGINGTVGFENTAILSIGYYVDGDLSTVKNNGTLVPQAADTIKGNYANAYIVQVNLYDFAPGSTHTITYVVETEAGFIDLCQWTVTMAEASNDAFVDTDKPNVNVIIIAGQSNACGASPITQSMKDQYSNVNYQNVYMQYKNTYVEGNNIYTACESAGFEKYYYGMGGFQAQHFGPEAGLAYYLATNEATKNEQWFIVKYAATGTTITQWINGVMLADELVDFVDGAIVPLTNEYDVQIRGLLWMQGETDASAEGWANAYKANEQQLASHVRNAFAKYATRTDATVAGSGISFISAGIAPNSLDGQQTNGLVGNVTADGGRNDWKWSATVNWAKFENAEWWYLPNVTGDGSVFGSGIAAGWYYTNQGTPGIINSVYIDTYTLIAKNEASDAEKNEYVVESDKTDWAHYSSGSMIELGTWFGEALTYMAGKADANNNSSATTSKTYTVTYNANGSSVTPDKVVVAEGKAITLLPATREGYTFKGWSDGTKTYAAGAEYTVTGDVTLTAQWEAPVVQYTVTYNANGGSVSSASATVNAGESVTLPTPSRTFYSFNGWYDAATGGNKIGDAGAAYTPTGNVTLYAQWKSWW